jgi:hypothetical protein
MPAIVNGTDGITFPSWTTPTRPAVPVAGQAGFNTTIGAMETYTGSAWSTSDLPATGASGNFLQSNGTSWTSAPTLAVSNGGTGQTTLTTAYGVLAAGTTATGALQNIGTGTSTQILTSNGPGVLPSWQSAAAGGFSNMTVYASPGTFTTPSTTTRIKVTVVGGGGAGGLGAFNPTAVAGGGGGGGGGAAIYVGPVAASSPFSVTVGGAGGTSSFAALASATGGSTGLGNSSSLAGRGGAGGAGSAGTLQVTGGAGGTGGSGVPAASVNGTGGAGGSSLFGGGGVGAGGTNPGAVDTGNPGGNYGGGGGGSRGGASVGSGAGGVVIVEF